MSTTSPHGWVHGVSRLGQSLSAAPRTQASKGFAAAAAPTGRDQARLKPATSGRSGRLREGRLKPTDIRNPDVFHKVVDCQWACPAHTPVPEYIRLIAAGRYTDAYMVNWESNVFP